ncbi:cobyric acid synthase [uncultured Sphingomonas sp.]|uniref:cobyric acid synthase n=1 Tax=unclassified Sphingomonas TaxID=196159 RepID=UPI0025E8A2DD|nr:cobyric acid synthase [uncultured Sphingomonas sp.]
MAAVMLQGTGSDVGKSVLVAGLCRALANRGYRVRPFKPQNMSNNAAVADDGGEIGRAQALQAIAARVPPSANMNPVLLKPQSDRTSQLIVAGRPVGVVSAADHWTRRPSLLGAVLDAYNRLSAEADIVVVEGAGSPAEVNLRHRDIANMGFARAAGVPVVMVGDIDRGGVIASLVGTQGVIDAGDAAMIRGFIVNKFRGDPALFNAGLETIAASTGWQCIGMVPWLPAAVRLPAEDAVALDQPGHRGAGPLIAIPMLSRIANFDDFDALAAEPGVRLCMIPPGQPLPGDAALVVLPGTKATIADLAFFRAQGWDIDLAAHVRRGGRVLGICGGYQMLGRTIADRDGIEGMSGTVEGLDLLPIHTTISAAKHTRRITGMLAHDEACFDGYEIHAGITHVEPGTLPMLRFEDGTIDGAVTRGGQISGCYIHGLFDHPAARAALLAPLGAQSHGIAQHDIVDSALEEIASTLERVLDIPALISIGTAAA